VRITVVLNSSAGTLMGMSVEEARDRIRDGFVAGGHDATVHVAAGADIPGELARASEGGADAVVVGGGDGTIATAARHLVGRDIAMGVLPLGTMNLLARDLAMPMELDAAVNALAAGRIRAIDVCDVNGHVFLNNAVLGLYPRMVEERERQRGVNNLRKWPAMVVAAAEVLWSYRRLHVEIEVDGSTRTIRTPILAVANNVYDEGLGVFMKRGRLDAGEMGVYVANHTSPIGLVTLMVRLFIGGWQRDTQLETFVVRELTVRARRRRIRVAIDGEVLRLRPPLHFRIRPGALRMLVPAED
jgi:diacylglycerol kinase family enzyme